LMAATDLEVTGPAALVRRAAGYGLPGHDEDEPMTVSTDAWPAFLAQVDYEKLAGIAVAAVEGEWLHLSDEQRSALFQCHREFMVHALRVERMLLTAGDALARSGVETIVLKGPAVAHGCYPDPSWRSFGDLDLLVRTEQWRAAEAVLLECGFRRNLPEPKSGFDERFGKAAEFANGEDLEIDLHRTLVLGSFGLWMNPDELFARAVPFELGGVVHRRLDDTGLLVHACLHASLGWRPPLLLPLRDVAQIPQVADVDWDVVSNWARRWRLTAVVQHALRAASEAFGVGLPPGAAPLIRVQPGRREARALEAYTTDRRRLGGIALSTIRAIPGVRGKAAFIRALLFPDREFLAVRAPSGRGRSSYLRRWRVPFRWLRARSRRKSPTS